MTQPDRPEDATPGDAEAAGIGADQGNSVPAPKPSTTAAAAAGAVGPGALAAVETPGSAQPVSAPETVGELTADDIETLRGLARRAGGVEALLRWLQRHPDRL